MSICKNIYFRHLYFEQYLKQYHRWVSELAIHWSIFLKKSIYDFDYCPSMLQYEGLHIKYAAQEADGSSVWPWIKFDSIIVVFRGKTDCHTVALFCWQFFCFPLPVAFSSSLSSYIITKLFDYNMINRTIFLTERYFELPDNDKSLKNKNCLKYMLKATILKKHLGK